jgi:hypothetical protein
MATLWVQFDTSTGKLKATSVSAGGLVPKDQNFDVGAGGQANFVVTRVFDANSTIDVSVNGKLLREGSSYDYVRNVGLNRIEATFTVPQNAWVKIRVWT